MTFQYYEEHLNGDWGGMTDEQVQLMRAKIIFDPELTGDERETLLAKADKALRTIEEG